MGRPALALTLAAGLLAGGCGDAVVILGDWPGYMRVVAGVPGSYGLTFDTIATRTKFWHPHGVTAAPDGAIFVSDENGPVIRVDPGGRALRILPIPACVSPCVQQPAGMAWDSAAGALILADPSAQRIWSVGGTATPIAGTGDIASGPDGPGLSTPISFPAGIAVDAAGRIYFSERGGSRVRRLDADGSLHTVAGSDRNGFGGDGGLATAAALNGPAGITIAGGVLYIADAGNQRIRAVDLSSGIIRTVAGTGASGYYGDDGPATQAMLNSPQGLAASLDGRTIYIADTDNNRIRFVNVGTGVIRTLVGTGATAYTGTGLSAGETALDHPTDVAVSRYGLLFIVDAGHFVVWRTPLGI